MFLLKVIADKGGSTTSEIRGFTYFFQQHSECLIDVFNKDTKEWNVFALLT